LMESMRVVTASVLDQNIHSAVIAAVVKYHTTELARKIVNHAMDIHGGKAIMMGPSNYLAGAYESIPISITVEGANILTRHLMIFGQGLVRCHPYLLSEIKAKQLSDFEKPFLSHLGWVCSLKLRFWFHLLTGQRFCGHVRGLDKDSNAALRQLSFSSLLLSLLSELSLMLLGGKLKRRERLSARLGDVLSHLLMAAMVVRYSAVHQTQEEMVPLRIWALQYCAYQCQVALREFLDNVEGWITPLIRWMCFPLRGGIAKPSDNLEQIIALQMLNPSVFRDRLTAHTYQGDAQQDPIAQLEEALRLKAQVDPIVNKVKQAQKAAKVWDKEADISQCWDWGLAQDIITPREQELGLAYERLRQMLIQVDEFEPAFFTK